MPVMISRRDVAIAECIALLEADLATLPDGRALARSGLRRAIAILKEKAKKDLAQK